MWFFDRNYELSNFRNLDLDFVFVLILIHSHSRALCLRFGFLWSTFSLEGGVSSCLGTVNFRGGGDAVVTKFGASLFFFFGDFLLEL